VRRLTSVGFDNDGNGTVDETVAYEYDAGGLRTKLTLPGSLNIIYSYNARGQLIALTDWSAQKTAFAYDNLGRHIASERHNGLRSSYAYDAGSRLRMLRHSKDNRTLAHFAYEVDKRGNRTQAFEALAQPATTTDTIIAFNDKSLVAVGTWTDVSLFKETTQFHARLMLAFMGDEATLTMGTGPDHSIYDVYIGGSLWQSFDGYAAVAGQRDIVVTTGIDGRKLNSEGPHIVEIRNRAERNAQSSAYKLRFKQLLVVDRTYTLQTIRYSYDALSRLTEARTAPGVNALASDANLLRREQFTYDRAGNRTQGSIALNGAAPTVTNYTYNAGNQLTAEGATTYGYDDNGNLTTINSLGNYGWDRANRMTSASNTTYRYDGAGNRIYQRVGTVVTNYLLDLQPGLAVVLAATTGANTDRYVHGQRGIHAQRDAANNWEWMVQDGLGSVRGVADNNAGVLWGTGYAAYGAPINGVGTAQTMYGFTGEPTDSNGLVHLRARYYNPAVGIFPSLDPFEGMAGRPMSLNGYSWVEGNAVNAGDPSGLSSQCLPFNSLKPSGIGYKRMGNTHCDRFINELDVLIVSILSQMGYSQEEIGEDSGMCQGNETTSGKTLGKICV
jgi:RHS repeat-associated protein